MTAIPGFFATAQSVALANSLDGATLDAYLAGTSTATPFYSDRTLSTSLGSQITADSDGRFSNFYLPDDIAIKLRLRHTSTSTDLTFDYVTLDETVDSVVGFRNVVQNPDFVVAQRGTTFPAIADGAFFADRWRYEKVGAAVHTVTPGHADAPTVAQAGRYIPTALLVDCTTADSSIAAGDYVTLVHPIEGYVWRALAQRDCTLSFWVKATKSGTYCVALGNSGADRSYVAEYTVTLAGTWEFKTVTFTASPSAGTWDYTNGIGATLTFALSCGSTFQTTAGAWQTGNFFGTSNQVNATDSGSNDFQLVGVQLEAGDTASTFEARPFATELALCERYFEKSFAYATAPAQSVGITTGEFGWSAIIAGTTTNRSSRFHFRTRKRVSPTMTLYNPAAGNAEARNTDDSADCMSTAAFLISETGVAFTTVGNAANTVGDTLRIHWTAEAEI